MDLLNHCQIHEAADVSIVSWLSYIVRLPLTACYCFQLMDGRKPVGGKLEVKIRLRNPIVGKEMEQVQEKWTVLTC